MEPTENQEQTKIDVAQQPETQVELISKQINDVLDALFSKDSVTRGFYLTGEAGNSKSYSVYAYLKSKNIEYIKYTARVTSLSLYSILYENKDKLLVFDDVSFDDGISIDLLKGALNEGGVVCWHTSRDLPYPYNFVFTGRIIIITNRGLKDTKLFYPLFSRCYTLVQNLSLQEYKEISSKICSERGVEFSSIEPYLTPFLCHRDLRVVNKAIDFVLASKPEQVKKLFPEDEQLLYLDMLLKEHKNDNQSIVKQLWCERFDRCTKTYYRKLKRYKEVVPNE